ncbi:MAG: PKD domain-containing protein [Bacteroidia bacterium]
MTRAHAQCTNTQLGGQSGCARSSFYRGEIVPSNGSSPISVSPYSPGEYFRVPVLAGGCYTVGTCGAPFDTQINIFQGNNTTGPFAYDDDSGPLCSGLTASCSMVPSFTDYARVDVRQYPCAAGGSSSITVTIQQNNNLSITSSNAAMCQGQTRALTAVPVAVTGALPNSGSSGAFSGTGVTGNNFVAPTPAGNSQNYVVTYSFGYCTSTQTIQVFHAPSAAQAGANQTVCTSSTTLGAATPAFGNGTWSVLSGTGAVTTPSSATSALTGLTSGQATVLLWTVSNGPCASTMDTVVIFRDSDPSLANAGADMSLCQDSLNLSGNTPAIGTGTWTRIGGAGVIVSPNNPSSPVSGLGLGPNAFVWTISNGVCASTKDTVLYTRDQQPSLALAGPDKSICGSSTNLTGNIPTVGNGMWTVLSGSGVVTAPTTPNSPLNGVNIGTTVLTWSISNGTCPTSVDTMLVTRNAIPNPPTVAGSQSVCFGDPVTLTGSSTASNPSYVWWDAPAGGNALAGGPTYTSPPLTGPIVVYLEVTDGNTQCSSTRTQYNVNVNPLPTPNLGPDSTFCDSDSLCLNAGAAHEHLRLEHWQHQPSLLHQHHRHILGGRRGSEWLPWFRYHYHHCSCIAGGGTRSGHHHLQWRHRQHRVQSQPGITYSWNTGPTTSLTPVTTSGTYILTATNGTGCTGSDEIVVSALQSPIANFAVDTSGCPSISFTDLSTDAVSWTWSFGDGNSSVSQSPNYNYQNSGNGTYNVTLVVNSPCGADTISQSIQIDCIVGLNVPPSMAIALYPNPNDGMFKIKLDAVDADVDIRVFNELGQQVFVQEAISCHGSCEQVVNLRGTAAGVYFAKIQVGDVTISKRVIVR